MSTNDHKATQANNPAHHTAPPPPRTRLVSTPAASAPATRSLDANSRSEPVATGKRRVRYGVTTGYDLVGYTKSDDVSQQNDDKLSRDQENGAEFITPRPCPAMLNPLEHRVLDLQRAVGNRALASALQRQHVALPGMTGERRQRRGPRFAFAMQTLASAALAPGRRVAEVLAAIRASDAAQRGRFWTDPSLRGQLERAIPEQESLELARLLIRWGDERAIPPGVTMLRTAVLTGDRQAAMTASRLISSSEALALTRDQIVGDVLQRWIAVLGSPNGTDYSYDRAIERHRLNMQRTEAALQALATESSERGGQRAHVGPNTAEYLRSGLVRVNVLTPCHDGRERAIRQGRATVSNDKTAYFGIDNNFPDASATYDAADMTSRRNTHVDDPPETTVASARGGHGRSIGARGEVSIYDPLAHSDERLRRSLVHELQHIADKHFNEPGSRTAELQDSQLGTADQAWNEYKSEFRAFWVSGEYDGRSETTRPGRGFGNERQVVIFDHIHSAYVTIREHYDRDHRLADGRSFRDAVHGYVRPEGVNLINSVRVERFYRLLELVRPDSRPSEVRYLIEAAGRFTQEDRSFINSSSAWRLQQSIGQRCRGRTLDVVARAVANGPAPSWAAHVRQQPEWRRQ